MKSNFPKEFENRIFNVLKFGLDKNILKEVFLKANGDICFFNVGSSSIGTVVYMLGENVIDLENHFIINYDDIDFKIALKLFEEDELIANVKYKHKTEENIKAFSFCKYISNLFDFKDNLYIYHYLEELDDNNVFDYYRVVHYQKGFGFLFQSEEYNNEKLLLNSLRLFLEAMFDIIISPETFTLDDLPEYAKYNTIFNY